ncbi:hypothetical protein [Streptomyces echinatus]|uniref:hypothetical protein n=1 Tax=Streptomyces echinatus TaxID=67293 RepID=UPI0031F053D0
MTEDFADAALHPNGPLWVLAGRRSRQMPQDAMLHASVRLRRERDPAYRPDLPGPAESARWADPDWTKPAHPQVG